MTPCERVRAVYRGQRPDQVPLMLDLSHWYKRTYRIPFDLTGFKGVDQGLVALHREMRAVCYVEMGSFYDLVPQDPGIRLKSWTEQGVFRTELNAGDASLREERVFNPRSYSYGIRKYLLDSVEDFPVVRRLMDSIACTPRWERLRAWVDALGELAFPYVQLPYSGLGYLISRNFGIEKTVYAAADHPGEVSDLVESINACNLRVLDAIIDGPCEVLLVSDNYDAAVQTEELFTRYSRDYYREVARRVHGAGKWLAVHVDGEMRGALRRMAACGVDCIDAATPSPMFSLSAEAAREEAGDELILSGGIPATVFGGTGSEREFTRAVRGWLETRQRSARLILAAGDQVPPDAPRERIESLHRIVDRCGRY
jgi:hypothetical protein